MIRLRHLAVVCVRFYPLEDGIGLLFEIQDPVLAGEGREKRKEQNIWEQSKVA